MIPLAKLRERPGDPFVLFNIGWVAIDRRDPKSGLGYLRSSLAASAPRDSIVRKTFVLIAWAYQMVGDPSAVVVACRAGLAVEPDDGELLFREALVLRELGDSAGVVEAGARAPPADEVRQRGHGDLRPLDAAQPGCACR